VPRESERASSRRGRDVDGREEPPRLADEPADEDRPDELEEGRLLDGRPEPELLEGRPEPLEGRPFPEREPPDDERPAELGRPEPDRPVEPELPRPLERPDGRDDELPAGIMLLLNIGESDRY